MKITLTDIANYTNGVKCGNAIIENISIDSRAINENSLFIGIKGENFDGNDFIEDALSNGAKAVLTTKDVINAPSVKVSDGNEALLVLSKEYKARLKNLKTVAVTGSVGKTTTKEMIASVLERAGETHKNKGNLNNHIGVPLTVLGLEKKHKYAVIEMGMSNFGEISVLSDIVKPDIGVITNIGVSHIEFLGSREGIRDAKLEILGGLRDILILNGDEPLLFGTKTDKKVFYFGIDNEAADIKARNIEMFDDYMEFTAVFGHRYIRARINTVGRHNVYNALVAILVGVLFELTDEQILEGLLKFKNEAMRQNVYTFNGYTIIDDCYNASSPLSMYASLDVLASKNQGKKVAVLGAMKELGEHSKKAHEAVLTYALKTCDDIILYGENWKEIDMNSAKYFDTKEEISKYLKETTKSSDALLFKGSRYTKMEEVLRLFTLEV